jgi:hypothetical protein
MFQGKVKTEWLTKGALSPTLVRILIQSFLLFLSKIGKLTSGVLSVWVAIKGDHQLLTWVLSSYTDFKNYVAFPGEKLSFRLSLRYGKCFEAEF